MFYHASMAYRQEKLDEMANAVLPLQRQIEPYVTVRQAAGMWGMSTTGAYKVLQVMLSRGMVRKVGKRHYHIEVTK